MRIYACTVHVYPCPKTSIDWSSRSQAFVPAAGPAGRASTARAKLAAQKQVSNGSNAWIGGSFFGWHIYIQLGRRITCNDFRGWNLEDHFSIQLYLIWTLGHNCVRLRLLWADFVWLRNFGAGAMMISIPQQQRRFSQGHLPQGNWPQCALKKGLILGYPINIVDFSILDIKNCKEKRRKTTSARRFTTIWPMTGLSQLVRCHGPPAALPSPIFCRHLPWRLWCLDVPISVPTSCGWKSVKIHPVFVGFSLGGEGWWRLILKLEPVDFLGREVEAIQVLEEKAGQIQLGLVRGSEHLHISEFWTVTGVLNLQISRVLSGIPRFFSGLRGPVPSFFYFARPNWAILGCGSDTPQWDQSICGSYCEK